MDLLTEKQVSELLNISARTLQHQRMTGTGIPYIKIGRAVRYDFNQLIAYIDEHSYQSTTEYRRNDSIVAQTMRKQSQSNSIRRFAYAYR